MASFITDLFIYDLYGETNSMNGIWLIEDLSLKLFFSLARQTYVYLYKQNILSKT